MLFSGSKISGHEEIILHPYVLYALIFSWFSDRNPVKIVNMNQGLQEAHPHDYLTTREAAALLGVALRTVQLWVEAGTLSAWKTAGGHRRITRESVAALLDQQAAAGNASPLGRQTSEPYQILVVDDDATMREIMVTVIRSWGLPVSVKTAEDGFAALLSIGESHPDLLLTDLIMPGMDGYRMIRHLRAMPESRLIDVIAISGQNPDEIARAGLLPQDVPLLTKPVPFDRLLALLRERLAGRN